MRPPNGFCFIPAKDHGIFPQMERSTENWLQVLNHNNSVVRCKRKSQTSSRVDEKKPSHEKAIV